MTARRFTRANWFGIARGRPNQPPGRHSIEHQAATRAPFPANQPNRDGMYPMGQPYRVPHDTELDQRENNDVHVRTSPRRSSK